MPNQSSPCSDHPYPPDEGDPRGRCKECVEAEHGGGEPESTNSTESGEIRDSESEIAEGDGKRQVSDGAMDASTQTGEKKSLTRAERRRLKKPLVLISRALTEIQFEKFIDLCGLTEPFPNIPARWGRPIEVGPQMGAENPGGLSWRLMKEVGWQEAKDFYLYAFIGPRLPLEMRPRKLGGLQITPPEILRADYAKRDPRLELSFMEWCAFKHTLS